MHTFRFASAFAVVGIGAILSGCGGGLPSTNALTATATATTPSTAPTSSGTRPTVSPRATTTPETSVPTPKSRQTSTLSAFVIRASDLPGGWTAHAVDQGRGTGSGSDSDCAGPDTSPDMVGDKGSPDFWHRDATISSEATKFRSENDVDTDVASLLDPKNRHCDAAGIGRDFLADAPKGSKLLSATSTVTPRSAGQPANLIATEKSVVRIQSPDELDTIYIDDAYIRGPRLEVFLDFVNFDAPVSPSLRAAVIAKVAARAAKA